MHEHDIIPPEVLAAALKEAQGKELPLKFDGFTIGTALILSEGHIVAKLDTSEVSKEVRERIFGDTTRSISIAPRNT